MEKKLTAQGPKDRKSYTVTLPIDWIKEQKLDKHKRVELEIVGRKIVLSPGKDLQEREIIDGEKYNKAMIKVLQGLYRAGVNEIKISYKDSKILTVISSLLSSRLIGYEIIENKKNYVLIKDITGDSNESFDTLLRRVFFLILELKEAKDLHQIDNIDKNIKKLVNYCQRVLIKRGHSDYIKTPFYYILLDQLEKLNDEYTWILSLPDKKRKNLELFKEINECLRKAYELYYKFNIEEYNKYEYLTYEIKHKIKKSSNITVFDMHLHNLARQLNTIYGNIFVLRFKNQ